jgi:uncharacterized coiled-coil DUF342 family protein
MTSLYAVTVKVLADHQVAAEVTQRLEELTAEDWRLQRELAGCHSELQQLATQAVTGESAGLAATRAADLQERIVSAERRLTEVRDEKERLRRDLIEETDAARALADFESVWVSLNFREQAHLLRLLIAKAESTGSRAIRLPRPSDRAACHALPV